MTKADSLKERLPRARALDGLEDELDEALARIEAFKSELLELAECYNEAQATITKLEAVLEKARVAWRDWDDQEVGEILGARGKP